MVLKIEPNAGGGQRGRRGLTQSQYQEIEEGQSGEDSSSVEGCSRCQVYHCIVH